MSVVDSIKEARKEGFSDEEILEEVERQNSEKRDFFDAAKSKGAGATEILNDIIKQQSFGEGMGIKEEGESSPEKESEGMSTFLSKKMILPVAGALLLLIVIGSIFFFTGEDPEPEPGEIAEREECEEKGFHWYNENCHEEAPEAVEITEREECEEYDFYYYNEECHSGPPEPADFADRDSCEGEGFHWYNESCNPEPWSCGKEVLDRRDKELYGTVEINGECWLSENLRIDEIEDLEEAQDKEEWREMAGEEPIFATKENTGEGEMVDVGNYGYLYNWIAVDETDLCPEGWSVPTDEEWHELETYLSKEDCRENRNIHDFNNGWGCSSAGSKMMGVYENAEDNGSVWNDPEWNCKESEEYDCSGFNGLPAGYRYSDGDFGGLGRSAIFWSSSLEDANTNMVLRRQLGVGETGIRRVSSFPGAGFSVRCLKD